MECLGWDHHRKLKSRGCVTFILPKFAFALCMINATNDKYSSYVQPKAMDLNLATLGKEICSVCLVMCVYVGGGALIKDWSLITGRGGYKMGKPRDRNFLRPLLKTG